MVILPVREHELAQPPEAGRIARRRSPVRIVRPRRTGRVAVRTTIVVAILLALLTGLVAAPVTAAPPDAGSFPATIDAYARYEGQTQCLTVEQPGVRDFRDLVLAAYPSTGRGNILRACNSGGRSEHKEGRAWDWGVNVNNPAQKAAADELLAWLLATDEHGNRHAMARRFGIMYIIWNRQVWHSYRAERGWQPYTGASPHTDHVHFSFSWDGARKQTSYWTGGGPFPDVPYGSRLDEPVTWLVETGITQGDQRGYYRPSTPITRAQMASMLWRLMGEPQGAPAAGFPDVPARGPHHRAIDWLADTGITVGDADGAFRPDASITRGQMGLLLWRLAGTPAGSPSHGFTDVANIHAPAVSWLAATDITQGTTPEHFGGGQSVTRGQLALFLYRMTGNPDAWEHADPIAPVVRF